jgi:NAD+ kinase
MTARGGTVERIGIVAKQGEPRATEAAQKLARWLESRGLEVFLQAKVAEQLGRPADLSDEELPGASDLMVVLGGDGTLLYAARLVGPRGVPIFPVNLGHLGFLCNSAVHNLIPSMQAILDGECKTVERMLLHGTILGEDGTRSGPHWALNDLVIHLASIARTMTLRIRIDGFMAVPSLVADGLIVSSPTGSTAYNLSAGGPVLSPSVQAMILAPMMPISLSQRPVVVDGASTLEIEFLGGLERALVTLDGQDRLPFVPGDRLVVERADRPVRLLHVGDWNFYQVLREKMGWASKPGGGKG